MEGESRWFQAAISDSEQQSRGERTDQRVRVLWKGQ